VTARLSYVANESGCPDETSFRNLVGARLGYDPFEAGGVVNVRVEIVKGRGRLQGHAEVTRGDSPPGSRDLSGELDRCEPLATAIATTVAIALDPGRGSSTADLPSAPPLAPPPPPSASTVVVVRERDVVVASPPPAPPASRERPSLVGVAGGVASAAVGPALMFGPDLGVMVRLKTLSLEASARVETTLGEARATSGDRLEATVVSGAVVPCAHLRALAGCVFGRVGAFQSGAPNVTEPVLRSSPFAAVGLRAAYVLTIGPVFALRGAIETGLPLVRTSLVVDGNTVWTPPPVFAGASLAALIKFL
jgi:hypothetical protein